MGKESANDRKKRHRAEMFFDNSDYYNALLLFNELLEKDTTSAYLNYHVGVCKYHLKRFRSEALKHLERSNARINAEIYYYLGRLYHLDMKFDKALDNLRKYQALYEREYDDELIAQLIKNVSSAKTLMEKPVTVEINNLGGKVNSVYPEYVPLISADGKKLFFTSRRLGSTGNEVDILGNYYEDIYVTQIIDGSWSTPLNLPSPVNTESHDACVGLTPEGENLLIYRNTENLTGGDIFMTEFDGEKWTNPVMLDPVVNNPDWIEPSAVLTASGDQIIFSSNRPGGFGGLDLYRTVKLPNGQWSLAQNLGPNINTQFDEDAPFIHPDGSKLYFSSKGHVNMGGFDVFRSDLDENGQWKSAVNMGYPLNTVDDDIYFVLSADGTIGFFSSIREQGLGETDIYSVSFLENSFGYIVKNGMIRSDDGQPLAAKVTLVDTENQKLQGIYRSNRLTGRFIFLYNPEFKYELIISAEGYYPVTLEMEEEQDIILVELTPKTE